VTLDVDRIAVNGEWIRHAPHDSDLLGRPAQPTDGRWQHAQTVGGLYLADEADTAIAEWYRYLAELSLQPERAIPHDHHIWQVQTELADLCDVERLHRVGLDQPRPSRKTWPSCQDVGDTLWREGWPGLLTLSGARPDHTVLCLFTTNWPPPDASPVRVTEIREMPTPPLGMTT